MKHSLQKWDELLVSRDYSWLWYPSCPGLAWLERQRNLSTCQNFPQLFYSILLSLVSPAGPQIFLCFSEHSQSWPRQLAGEKMWCIITVVMGDLAPLLPLTTAEQLVLLPYQHQGVAQANENEFTINWEVLTNAT